MALINKTDPEAVGQVLATSLARHRPGATEVTVGDVVIPQSSGMSNDTVLFTARWKEARRSLERRLVARIAPTGPSIFVHPRLDVEASVISALAKSTVPVPDLLIYETDLSALGAPFLVMGFVEGRAASDDPPFTATGWVVDLDAAARRTLAQRGLEAIAAIHAFDWRTGGLADLDRSGDGRSPLRVVMDDIREFYDATSADLANPTVEAGLDWLEANWPETESEPVLTWGDARLGNLLYGDDLAVNAVLDWEMVTIGPRELDLGWWTFLLRHHTDGIGVPLPAGLPTSEESVTYYADLTGHHPTHFRFYEVLAGVRLSILTQRAASLLIDAGVLPPVHQCYWPTQPPTCYPNSLACSAPVATRQAP